MKPEDVPHEEYMKIAAKLEDEGKKRCEETVSRLNDLWKTYSLETKFRIYEHAMCQLITIFGDTELEQTPEDLMSMILSLSMFGKQTIEMFLRLLIPQIYEEKLTPDLEELKRMMEL